MTFWARMLKQMLSFARLGSARMPRQGSTIRQPPRSTSSEPDILFKPERGRAAGQLLQPGQRFGDYAIERRLGAGQGGMGEVYEAEHTGSGRIVALKLLRKEMDSEEDEERFMNEGRGAAKVSHPNSVLVYGAEIIEGTPAIAMELVAGGSLQDWVTRAGELPVKQAVEAVLQTIAGLEAALVAGILHRDIKPANCFVENDGTVKVGDYGIAIPAAGADSSGASEIFYSPGYASPEQMKGGRLDVRSDIFSVGATLYCLLTGNAPFNLPSQTKNERYGREAVEGLLTQIAAGPKSPAALRTEVSETLAAVVLRCLQPKPSDRFQSYQTLRRALLPFTWPDEKQPVSPLDKSSFAANARTLPYSLLQRQVALALDSFVVMLVAIFLPLLWMRSTGKSNADIMWFFYVTVLYFTLLEAFGVSVGKSVFRIRTVTLAGKRPGLVRAFVRCLVFCAVPFVLIAAFQTRGPPPRVSAAEHETRAGTAGLLESVRESLKSQDSPSFQQALKNAFPFSGLFSMYHHPRETGIAIAWVAILLYPARRRNGFAGLHDLLSGTRVIPAAGPGFVRPQLPATRRATTVPDLKSSLRVGPYLVTQSLSPHSTKQLLLGYDDVLRRYVWIVRLTAGHPETPGSRREMKRSTRLRWLRGERSQDQCWDSYDAPSGEPLLNVIRKRQPWERIRWWLLDLAKELYAASEEESPSVSLGLDRIWIAADGRALLLEFQAPGTTKQPADAFLPSRGCPHLNNGREFLVKVAICALEGRVVAHVSPDMISPKGWRLERFPSALAASLERLRASANWASLVGEMEGMVRTYSVLAVRDKDLRSSKL